MTTVTVLDEQWRDVVEQAMEQGHARGLPKPAGLRGDGNFNLATSKRSDGTMMRTLYYGVKGEWTVLGRCVEDQGRQAEAASVNGTGKGKAARSGDRPKQTPPPTGPAPEREPAPAGLDQPESMILLTPAAGGAWRLNAYGVDAAAVIRALRVALVHLVARQSGITIIDELIAPEFAVVANNGFRERMERTTKQAARRTASGGRTKTTVRYPADDEEFGEGDW